MKVNSTELQNNFGKYLMLAANEDIIITRNGTEIAKLSGIKNETEKEGTAKEGFGKEGFGKEGVGKEGAVKDDMVMENSAGYAYSGRKAGYEEFLQLTKESGERYEYIDGEIFRLASPKTKHQQVLTELFAVFYNWFQGKKCRPLVAPYNITLKRNDGTINVVQPDLMVICDLEEQLNEQDDYMGIPALVAEILSETTRSKDLIKKLDLYMSCGISEYWIINPLNQEVTIFRFADQNISDSITYRGNENARSYTFEGLSVPLAKIFQL